MDDMNPPVTPRPCSCAYCSPITFDDTPAVGTPEYDALVEARTAAIRLVRAQERKTLIERTARLREAARLAEIADKEGVIG